MGRTEHLTRRLHTATLEARDADRVWREAMTRHDRDWTGAVRLAPPPAVHVLWQERERARSRVEQLRWMTEAQDRRRGRFSLRTRLQSLRESIAFLSWYAGR
jgi:hypothetical protein